MSEETPQTESPLTSSVEKLRTELDRWLEVAWAQGGRALDAIGLRPCAGKWSPPVDVVESPNDVLVYVDLPGTDPNAVRVELTGNMLTIRGDRRAPCFGEDHTVHVGERSSGEFCRAIPMPVPVTGDEVTAEVHDGVLQIRLAKSEQAKAKQIHISTGGSVGE